MSFFDDLGGETVTWRRLAAGSRGTDGRWTNGSKTDTSIVVSAQPAGPKTLQMLPEGFRTRDPRDVFSDVELRTANDNDGVDSDYLQIDSVWFKVVSSAKQPDIGLPRYFAVVVRLQKGETVPA